MREYHVPLCEGLGVKFPGPTRHNRSRAGAACSEHVIDAQSHKRSWHRFEALQRTNVAMSTKRTAQQPRVVMFEVRNSHAAVLDLAPSNITVLHAAVIDMLQLCR
jgi:hypothetical protein